MNTTSPERLSVVARGLLSLESRQRADGVLHFSYRKGVCNMNTWLRGVLLAGMAVLFIVVTAQLGVDVAMAQNPEDECFQNCQSCVDCCGDGYASCIDQIGGGGECPYWCEWDLQLCMSICRTEIPSCLPGGPGECIPSV